MATDDLKQHIHTDQDFYALLSVPVTAAEPEIRRAYRKTALKYHPDKVGPADTAALDKFHLLQIAYDVLSDPSVRELYDNARRAREQKAEREQAYEGRRRWMKEDLEARERGAVGAKRKREEEAGAEADFERELRRLAEDGKRRRKEREEMLRRETDEEEKEAHEEDSAHPTQSNDVHNGLPAEVPDLDRSITLRFPATTPPTLTKPDLLARFARFGEIQDAVLHDKKLKLPGEKHRQPFTVAVLVYKSIVGAHAAVSDLPKLAAQEPDSYALFTAVGWAAGKEPACIPRTAPSTPGGRASASARATPPASSTKPARRFEEPAATPGKDDMPSTPKMAKTGDGLRKMPSFGSFKGTPKGVSAGGEKGSASPSVDEITMIRLKNAERRRMEEKIRREEEAEGAGEKDA